MSASKAKGTAAETAVVRFLQANGYPNAERRALAGNQDRGDVAGIPGLVIEVKAAAKMELAAWVDEGIRESVHEVPVQLRKRPSAAGPLAVAPFAVWHKRRGQGSPGNWYVTMDGWGFLALLERWTQ